MKLFVSRSSDLGAMPACMLVAMTLLIFCPRLVVVAQEPPPQPAEETDESSSAPEDDKAPEDADLEEDTASQPLLGRAQLLDSLTDEEVTKAIKAIQESFVDPDVASDSALQRAALEGLAVRFDPGISVSSRESRDSSGGPHAFVAEILNSHIGYVRPGALQAASLAQFDGALETFLSGGVDALILDLRSTGSDGDFEHAAEFARRLCEKGQMLFTLQRPSAKQERIFTANRDPVFDGLVVVLIDSRTSGPAEALAATLRANIAAMIIGADTSGAAVEFETLPLGSRVDLRLAVSQVLLPGSTPIFPKGVKPDIAISLPSETQNKIFLESAEKGVSQFVFETDRSRFNEAALVANTNPEIDSARDAQRNAGKARPPKDRVLQRAVDLVTAIQFYTQKHGG